MLWDSFQMLAHRRGVGLSAHTTQPAVPRCGSLVRSGGGTVSSNDTLVVSQFKRHAPWS